MVRCGGVVTHPSQFLTVTNLLVIRFPTWNLSRKRGTTTPHFVRAFMVSRKFDISYCSQMQLCRERGRFILLLLSVSNFKNRSRHARRVKNSRNCSVGKVNNYCMMIRYIMAARPRDKIFITHVGIINARTSRRPLFIITHNSIFSRDERRRRRTFGDNLTISLSRANDDAPVEFGGQTIPLLASRSRATSSLPSRAATFSPRGKRGW